MAKKPNQGKSSISKQSGNKVTVVANRGNMSLAVKVEGKSNGNTKN